MIFLLLSLIALALSCFAGGFIEGYRYRDKGA
jgi:hypothetical protein